jgi:hypothetical protein
MPSPHVRRPFMLGIYAPLTVRRPFMAATIS